MCCTHTPICNSNNINQNTQQLIVQTYIWFVYLTGVSFNLVIDCHVIRHIYAIYKQYKGNLMQYRYDINVIYYNVYYNVQLIIQAISQYSYYLGDTYD